VPKLLQYFIVSALETRTILLLPAMILRSLLCQQALTNWARLDKFWHNQDIVYDFRAQLQGTGSPSEVLYE